MKIHREHPKLKSMVYPEVMPFYFIAKQKFIVKIASWDLTGYDPSWMDCEVLGYDQCMTPDVDIAYAIYEFENEIDALKFILEWYKNQ